MLLLLSQASSCKYATSSSLLTLDSHCQIPNLCSPHSESTLAELGTQSYHPSQSHQSMFLPKVLRIEFLKCNTSPILVLLLLGLNIYLPLFPCAELVSGMYVLYC